MVCIRCIMTVRDELEKINLTNVNVSLGRAEFKENLSYSEISAINSILIKSGLEIIEDKKNKIIRDIKAVIVELIHYSNENLKVKLSAYISEKLNCSYPFVSKLFSEAEGITIEKYYLQQRIEHVKELLVYKKLTLTEISYRLNYSSLSHLSSQFKNTTGLNASHFKDISKKRNPFG